MAGRVSVPWITINASEVASIMGRHKYQPRHETMLKVWERMDSRTFCLANALEHKSEVATIVNDFYQNANLQGASSRRILPENWDEEEKSFIKVLQEIFTEKESVRWKIAKELKCLTIKNYRDEKLLKDAQIQPLELLEEAQKLSKNEKKPISESVSQLCEKKGIKNEEVIKAVGSSLQKIRGTKLESKAIEVFGKEKGVEISEVENFLEWKIMESDGITWLLQGRADAIMGDKIIEVKNRRYRFMQPLYDLIQLQAYLFLYDRDEGILLERFNEEDQETPVKFEIGFWIEDVIPDMKSFAVEVQDLIKKNKEHFSEVDDEAGSVTNKSPLKRPNKESDTPIPEKLQHVDEQEDTDTVTLNLLGLV